jgi:hypothetical protein
MFSTTIAWIMFVTGFASVYRITISIFTGSLVRAIANKTVNPIPFVHMVLWFVAGVYLFG